MSIIAEAFQPFIVRSLFELEGRLDPYNISDAIIAGGGAGYHIGYDAETSRIDLDFQDQNLLTLLMARDANRFLEASFTSVLEIKIGIADKNKLPWSLIHLYYSAFYAAHGLMRLFGQSCTYLDQIHINRLRSLSEVYEISNFSADGGLYRFYLKQGGSGFYLFKLVGRVGGAHESFWKMFEKFLDTSADDILTGSMLPSDARSVFAKLESLRRAINGNGGLAGSWLSKIRNELQYRHQHNCWPPSSINKTPREALSRIASKWIDDPIEIEIENVAGGILGLYVATCVIIIAMCRDVVHQISERSPSRSRSFTRSVMQIIGDR